MVRRESKLGHYWWAVAACFFAFGVGYIQHRWFYPLDFHGDSAAMHVLAKAILEQGALLPSDFSYGNQVIFLRSSWFIALVSAFGLTGLDAFVLGSALSIAFWGAILYLFLSSFLGSNRRALLFSTLLLLPFGAWDSDYILGQQSHLANVVLSLGIVTSISLYIAKGNRPFLVAAAVSLFVMSAEAPIRGLLTLGPLLLSLLFVVGWRRTVTAAKPMGLMFAVAWLFNKWLVHLRPISLRMFDTLSFKSTDDILNNLGKAGREAFGSMSSINAIAGEKISLIGFLALGAGLLLTAIYLGFFYVGAIEAAKTGAARLHRLSRSDDGAGGMDERMRLVRLTSLFGLTLGALVVAALNPDSARHYLWSIFIAKLFVIAFVFDFLSGLAGSKKAAALLVALAFLMSSWLAYLVKYHGNTVKAIRGKHTTEEILAIENISRNAGIRHVYGEDFWRMMPLNTLVPGLNAQTLQLENGEVRPFSWLTMPSWSCAKGDVLYYLKSGPVDEEIRKKLIDAGGTQLKQGAGYSLWRGPRVWQPPPASSC